MAATTRAKRLRIRESAASRAFDTANIVLLVLFCLLTLGPFLYLVLGSLTEPTYYRQFGVALHPGQWTLNAYTLLLSGSSRLLRSMAVTMIITVAGTALALTVTASLAYVLSCRNLPGRRAMILFIFFTMLFSGGLIPFYLVVQGLGMLDTLWALFIPFLCDAWYVLIMIKFFETIPQELLDSARIDGCSEIGIFARIVLPLSLPVLATIGLFFAVFYWNQWFWPAIFIREADLLPLQNVLRGVLSQLMPVVNPNAAMEQARAAQATPADVLRMASIIITVLPIAVIYPFLQRYFVKGVMVGAIKG
jgi:ABC-type glycerol-3-phosphate transport system permease component